MIFFPPAPTNSEGANHYSSRVSLCKQCSVVIHVFPLFCAERYWALSGVSFSSALSELGSCSLHFNTSGRSLLQKLHNYGRRKIPSHPRHLSKSACCCLYFLSNVAFHKFKGKYQFSRFQYYSILWR